MSPLFPPRTSEKRNAKRTTFAGLPINIEIEKGQLKSGVDEDGLAWSHTYLLPYGEILGTEGEDRDPVDVYLGPFETADQVFVVHQIKKDGSYDEDKVFLGMPGAAEAQDAYFLHGPSWGFGSMDIWTLDEFKTDYLAANRPTKENAMKELSNPTPKAGESEKDYKARFMGSEEARRDYPDEKQRYAVACGMWEKKSSLTNGLAKRFALYFDVDDRSYSPKVEQAAQEIYDAMQAKSTTRVRNLISKYQKHGADDTASKEAILRVAKSDFGAEFYHDLQEALGYERGNTLELCAACGGELEELGVLGNLRHYRCRACGMDQHEEAKENVDGEKCERANAAGVCAECLHGMEEHDELGCMKKDCCCGVLGLEKREKKAEKVPGGALHNAYTVEKVAGGWEVVKSGAKSGEIFESKAEANDRAKYLNHFDVPNVEKKNAWTNEFLKRNPDFKTRVEPKLARKWDGASREQRIKWLKETGSHDEDCDMSFMDMMDQGGSQAEITMEQMARLCGEKINSEKRNGRACSTPNCEQRAENFCAKCGEPTCDACAAKAGSIKGQDAYCPKCGVQPYKKVSEKKNASTEADMPKNWDACSPATREQIFRKYGNFPAQDIGVAAHDKWDNLSEEAKSAFRKAFKMENSIKPRIPGNYAVQPLKSGENPPGKMTCGTCELSWDDDKVTGMTPVPSGRCPFESFHEREENKNSVESRQADALAEYKNLPEEEKRKNGNKRLAEIAKRKMLDLPELQAYIGENDFSNSGEKKNASDDVLKKLAQSLAKKNANESIAKEIWDEGSSGDRVEWAQKAGLPASAEHNYWSSLQPAQRAALVELFSAMGNAIVEELPTPKKEEAPLPPAINADFNESEHPRKGGKFAERGGGSEGGEKKSGGKLSSYDEDPEVQKTAAALDKASERSKVAQREAGKKLKAAQQKKGGDAAYVQKIEAEYAKDLEAAVSIGNEEQKAYAAAVRSAQKRVKENVNSAYVFTSLDGVVQKVDAKDEAEAWERLKEAVGDYVYPKQWTFEVHNISDEKLCTECGGELKDCGIMAGFQNAQCLSCGLETHEKVEEKNAKGPNICDECGHHLDYHRPVDKNGNIDPRGDKFGPNTPCDMPGSGCSCSMFYKEDRENAEECSLCGEPSSEPLKTYAPKAGEGKGVVKVCTSCFKRAMTNRAVKKNADGGYDYVIRKTLDGIKAGKKPQQAFLDAAEDENFHGDREDIRADREKMVAILKEKHGIDVKPHWNAADDEEMFAKEKAEHPEFSDEQIRQIVADHKKSEAKNASHGEMRAMCECDHRYQDHDAKKTGAPCELCSCSSFVPEESFEKTTSVKNAGEWIAHLKSCKKCQIALDLLDEGRFCADGKKIYKIISQAEKEFGNIKENANADEGFAWRCQECGHKFASAAAAERAVNGDKGCPKCGGTDIDESMPVKNSGDENICTCGHRSQEHDEDDQSGRCSKCDCRSFFSEKKNAKAFEVIELADGRWAVTFDGVQAGEGLRDKAGASGQSWATRQEAESAGKRLAGIGNSFSSQKAKAAKILDIPVEEITDIHEQPDGKMWQIVTKTKGEFEIGLKELGNTEPTISDVKLVDDGTLDTVLSVAGCRHTFGQEEAAEYRDPKTGALTSSGFRTLAKEALEDHLEQCVENSNAGVDNFSTADRRESSGASQYGSGQEEHK